MSFTMRKISAGAVAIGLATLGGFAQSTPAQAQITACGSGYCVDYQALGDADYSEVLLSGTFKGQSTTALNALRLCDEKSDAWSATATITIALRDDLTGATSYSTYRGQEFQTGPLAGCSSTDPLDYEAPSTVKLWAVRADYDYKPFAKTDAISHPQTYHTGWVYNAYLQGWCPTCKTAGK